MAGALSHKNTNMMQTNTLRKTTKAYLHMLVCIYDLWYIYCTAETSPHFSGHTPCPYLNRNVISSMESYQMHFNINPLIIMINSLPGFDQCSKRSRRCWLDLLSYWSIISSLDAVYQLLSTAPGLSLSLAFSVCLPILFFSPSKKIKKNTLPVWLYLPPYVPERDHYCMLFIHRMPQKKGLHYPETHSSGQRSTWLLRFDNNLSAALNSMAAWCHEMHW